MVDEYIKASKSKIDLLLSIVSTLRPREERDIVTLFINRQNGSRGTWRWKGNEILESSKSWDTMSSIWKRKLFFHFQINATILLLLFTATSFGYSVEQDFDSEESCHSTIVRPQGYSKQGYRIREERTDDSVRRNRNRGSRSTETVEQIRMRILNHLKLFLFARVKF